MMKQYHRKWDAILTDRERFNNQMHYKSIDRCFNMEFGYWDENFRQWSMFLDNGITNNEEADAFFQFDRMEIVRGSVWMVPPFKEEVIDQTDSNWITRNADGLLAEVPKDKHDTIPHYIKASVVTPQDWEQVKAQRFAIDAPQRQVDIPKLKSIHDAEESRTYPLGVDCGSMIGKIRDMLTFEGLAYACYDYPEMVEDMVETCCRLVEQFLDQVLPHFTFDFASGWEDICFNNGPIVSPKFFKEVVVPRYKRIASKLHTAGIDLWWTDCDGDIRPILPLFLEGGINCMFPLEVNGSGHPGELLDQYGRELRIMGGVDKMALSKDRTAIDTYVTSLAPYVERGGYIPFVDHRCPPNVKEDDYLYYLDRKRSLFGQLG